MKAAQLYNYDTTLASPDYVKLEELICRGVLVERKAELQAAQRGDNHTPHARDTSL
jgi:hypothetical protein